jgi:spermidine/putrescine transport system permease protein
MKTSMQPVMTPLDWIGIADVRLINTPFAVLVGIVYAYLPLVVFPIFVSLEKHDKRLLEASEDLGAGGRERQGHLPEGPPGVGAGMPRPPRMNIQA